MGIAAKYLGETRRAEIARTLFTVKSAEEGKGELHGLCPLHNESNPSFAYNFKKDVYNCLSCGAGGDLLRLWCEVKGLGQKEGFKAFCEEFAISADPPGGVQKRRGAAGGGGGTADEVPSLDPEMVLGQMEKAWEMSPPLPEPFIKRLGAQRGWSPRWIEILDLRLQTHYLTKKGILSAIDQPDRAAIPIRDTEGKLVNIRLYRPGAKQYKIISFAKTTGTSRLFPARPFYDVDTHDENRLHGTILLCEGESDTICALSHGFNAITQTSKLKNFPPEQLVVFQGRDVVIVYDADEPGQKYTRYASQALAGTAKSIRVIHWPSFMGVDENGGVPKDHGQDLTDFFVRHKKTADDLMALIDAAERPIFPTNGIKSSSPAEKDIGASFSSNNDENQQPPGDIVSVKDFFDHGIGGRYSFKPRLLAERLLSEYRLMSDPASGLMYLWNGKYWEEFDEDHLKNVAIRYLASESQKSRIEDAIYQVRKLATLPHGRKVNDRLDWICLQNGMLNINTFEILPHDPDAYFTTIFPVSLDPSSPKRCDRFLKYLDTNVQTPEVIDQIQEFAGYILTRHARYEKCLFLFGPGRDGKSKLMRLLREMVGAKNCSAVSFPDLEREFPRSSLYNKLLNISTEIGSEAIESSYFKAITSGDPIQAAFKHKDNFEFSPYCKLIFAGNILPRIKDTSDALYERFLPVKFKRQFLEGDPDRDVMLLEKLIEELSEIFYWALCGLQRLMKNGRFTDCEETRELIIGYRRSNSPILSFIEDECIMGADQEVFKDELYARYRQYCGKNGYMPVSNNNFFRDLEAALNNLRIYRPRTDGKRKRAIQGVGLKGTT
jgi:putative DNA primase/helicase